MYARICANGIQFEMIRFYNLYKIIKILSRKNQIYPVHVSEENSEIHYFLSYHASTLQTKFLSFRMSE